MRLIQRKLSGRAFLLQFMSVMEEFEEEIPWLEPLPHATNGSYVRDRILQHFRCKDESEVIAMQFVTSDRPGFYFGGIIRFVRSPEIFLDTRNQEINERLSHLGYQFISCLQVREVHRGAGHGRAIMTKALRVVLSEHQKVWGVVSNPDLVAWYQSLGANVLSPRENKDDLWIVSWQK